MDIVTLIYTYEHGCTCTKHKVPNAHEQTLTKMHKSSNILLIPISIIL